MRSSRVSLKLLFSPPLWKLDGMAKEHDGEDNSEELSRGSDRGAYERVKVVNCEVDKGLAERCGQGEPKHRGLRGQAKGQEIEGNFSKIRPTFQTRTSDWYQLCTSVRLALKD